MLASVSVLSSRLHSWALQQSRSLTPGPTAANDLNKLLHNWGNQVRWKLMSQARARPALQPPALTVRPLPAPTLPKPPLKPLNPAAPTGSCVCAACSSSCSCCIRLRLKCSSRATSRLSRRTVSTSASRSAAARDASEADCRAWGAARVCSGCACRACGVCVHR